MSIETVHLELAETGLEACSPILREEVLWSNAESSDHKWVCHMPITRLAHHIPRPRIDHFNRLRPLWVINFCLCGLRGLSAIAEDQIVSETDLCNRVQHIHERLGK